MVCENPHCQVGIAGQDTGDEHALRLAAAHGLGKLVNTASRLFPAHARKRLLEQHFYAGRKHVGVKKLSVLGLRQPRQISQVDNKVGSSVENRLTRRTRTKILNQAQVSGAF